MTEFSLSDVSRNDMGKFTSLSWREIACLLFPLLFILLERGEDVMVSQPRHTGERTRVPGDRAMNLMASWSRAALPLGTTGEGNKLYCLSDHFGSLCYSSLSYTGTNVWTKTRLGKKLISWFQLLLFVSLVRHVAWQILILLYLAK